MHNMYYNFQNKTNEQIKIYKIPSKAGVLAQLPREHQNKENRPVFTYELTNTSRNKTLNYKDTVNLIYIEDEISFTLNTNPFEYKHSSFTDSYHNHIIAGDLRIVGASKGRKFLTKGPNYREPKSTNFNKTFAKKQIGQTILLKT